jgi:hypothetical protein
MYFGGIGRLFGFAHYGTLADVGLLLSAVAIPTLSPTPYTLRPKP